jgi:hypothetical protein
MDAGGLLGRIVLELHLSRSTDAVSALPGSLPDAGRDGADTRPGVGVQAVACSMAGSASSRCRKSAAPLVTLSVARCR